MFLERARVRKRRKQHNFKRVHAVAVASIFGVVALSSRSLVNRGDGLVKRENHLGYGEL